MATMEELLAKQVALLEAIYAGNGMNPAQVLNNPAQAGSKALVGRQKHDPPTDIMASLTDSRPLLDAAGTYGSFFQDMTLDHTLMNMLLQPDYSLFNVLPVTSTIYDTQKYGFFTGYNVDLMGNQTEPATPCEDPLVIDSAINAISMQFPIGRIARATKTFETTELIKRANMRQYDDFYILGGERGVPSMNIPWEQLIDNPTLLQQAAIRRELAELAIYFQDYFARLLWTGDPANNAVGGAYKEPYGLTTLINGDYANSGLTLENLNGAGDYAALNSLIVNYNDVLGFGTKNIYEYLSGVEQVLYRRARGIRALPVRWVIVMHSQTWDSLVDTLPMDMTKPWVNVPTQIDGFNLNANSGTDLYYLAMREQIGNRMELRLNGRTYPVLSDDTVPYTDGATAGDIVSDIWFIPLSVRNMPVLTIEHMDYSKISNELQPLPGNLQDMAGWTDGGRWLHNWNFRNHCWNVATRTEMRFKFTAPHLAARLQNVTARPNVVAAANPIWYFNDDGTKSGALGAAPPAVGDAP